MSPHKKTLKINFIDGSSIELELGKIVQSNNKKEILYFDKVFDNKWRVIVSDKTMKDFNSITTMELLDN